MFFWSLGKLLPGLDNHEFPLKVPVRTALVITKYITKSPHCSCDAAVLQVWEDAAVQSDSLTPCLRCKYPLQPPNRSCILRTVALKSIIWMIYFTAFSHKHALEENTVSCYYANTESEVNSHKEEKTPQNVQVRDKMFIFGSCAWLQCTQIQKEAAC